MARWTGVVVLLRCVGHPAVPPPSVAPSPNYVLQRSSLHSSPQLRLLNAASLHCTPRMRSSQNFVFLFLDGIIAIAIFAGHAAHGCSNNCLLAVAGYTMAG